MATGTSGDARVDASGDAGGDSPGGLTAAEAARRLGVKRETLYAYVSRGLLTSRRAPGARQSRFDPAEVRRLAERRRSGGRAGALELVVDSELTLLDPDGHLWFRGWDAAEACRRATFEDVAEWLWATGSSAPFAASPEGRGAALAAMAGLPSSARPVERFRVMVAAAATTDPLRFDRRPAAVAATGRRVIGTLVDASPEAAAPEDAGRAAPTVAARLQAMLCTDPDQRTAARRRPLEAALVLLADHEMASSTLAARVAASTWADPYLVVLAGLAVLGGPLHGGVSDRLVPLLREAARIGAPRAVGELLRTGDQPGGFGHPVYRERDPRADALWPLLHDAWPGHPVLAAADDLVRVVAGEGDTFPNVDLALGALVACAEMTPGAGETIFAVARCAGWLAHAMEEYQHRLRFRVRAAYTGVPPGDGPRG